MKHALIVLSALIVLAACKPDAVEAPPPVAMTEAAVGHYCQMNVLEHPGPKGQVHLKDVAEPLFFSQASDVIAYLRMPEQSHAIAAAYVSDMSRAPDWDHPGAENWLLVKDAFFVVGSDREGGMGAPEVVPFSARADADAFTAQHGGDVMQLDDIPDAAVLAPIAPGSDETADEGDYAARLRALTPEKQP